MKPFHLWLVAEVQRRALGPEAAIVTVDQALAESEASGERFYEAELHRLRGELIAQAYPERAGEAEADLLRAVEAARAQGARSLQARATRDLESLRSSLQAAL